MKLTVKVGIAFAILCGLMAVGGGFSYFNMSKIDDAFSFVVKEISLLSDDANAIGQSLLRNNKTANDMVFAKTPAELELARQQFLAQAKELDERQDALLARLKQIEQPGDAITISESLLNATKAIENRGQDIYQLQLGILQEGAQIDKIKTDFLTKISFAKVAVDLSFKSYADEDPYIASLTKQMVSQIGTLEYMVNAIFSQGEIVNVL